MNALHCRATASKDMGRYLTGEDPALVDHYPEFSLFRDIVFLFKALLSPTQKSLPELKQWKATDARLFWSVGKKIDPDDVSELHAIVCLWLPGCVTYTPSSRAYQCFLYFNR